MKRIALFVPGGLGDVTSGIHIPTLHGLIERLSNRFDIVAYSQRPENKPPSIAHCGKAVVRFLDVTHDSGTPTRTLAFLSAFLRDHRQRKFHMVHGMWGIPFGLYAVSLGRALRIPSVVSLLGRETASIPTIDYGDMTKQPRRDIMRWLWENATVLLAQSEYQADRARVFELRRSDVMIVPHGVDIGMFSTQKRHAPKKEIHFISIGDKNPVKDPITLLKTFAVIAKTVNSRLRLVGKDHFSGELRSVAAQLGISGRVEFVDFVPYSEIPRHLSWADIFLQTSLSEGGGAAVLEAAASNVALCGTNVGLLHDFARHGMAMSTNPGDHQNLADCVMRLLNRPAQLLSMRRRALAWVREHNKDWTVEKMTGIYEQLILDHGQSNSL